MSTKLVALILASLFACSSRSAPPPASTNAVTAPPAPSPRTPERRVLLDPIESGEGCSLGHYGIVIDLGEPNAHTFLEEPAESVERDGASWQRFSRKRLSLRFLPPSSGLGLEMSDAGKPELFVDARIRDFSARSASVSINGRALGTWALHKGETEVVTLRASDASVVGLNELVIRFNGVPKKSTDAIAEIDWIRIGSRRPPAYAATTRKDAIVSQSVGGVTKRALSLPAKSFVRCITYLPRGATVSFALATSGKGPVEVVVLAVRDGLAPRVLEQIRASDAAWQTVSLAVPDDLTEAAAAIEIEVPPARDARALLGELRLLGGPDAPPPAINRPARNAILVVLGQTPRARLGLYGGPLAMPALEGLARQGVVFDEHRATTSWAAGSFASMLTGLLPPQHASEADDARLASQPLTLARAVRDAGIEAVYFTANPTTSEGYGFDRDWGELAASLPNTDPSGLHVFELAAQWLAVHKTQRFLMVIHARGGHPPWQVPKQAVKVGSPDAYIGPLEPAHAAELLSKARRVPPGLRFGESDRARAWALEGQALVAHDDALGALLQALRDAGHDSDTALIVTSDAGTQLSARVPFGDDPTLDETTLELPLVIRPTAGVLTPGAHVKVPTSSLDLARTIVLALGLDPPKAFGGADVLTLAAHPDSSRLLAATSWGGRASLRQGPFVFVRARDRSQLCDLRADEGCIADVGTSYQLAQWYFRDAMAEVLGGAVARSGAPVLDAGGLAALRLWGR